jgi:hypothetical protein
MRRSVTGPLPRDHGNQSAPAARPAFSPGNVGQRQRFTVSSSQFDPTAKSETASAAPSTTLSNMPLSASDRAVASLGTVGEAQIASRGRGWHPRSCGDARRARALVPYAAFLPLARAVVVLRATRALSSSTVMTCAVENARMHRVALCTSSADMAPYPTSG